MKAPRLNKGDKIALISPSSPVADKIPMVKAAIQNFEEQTGLRIVLGKHALGQHHYASGTRQQRLDDFHWAIKDKDIKGIVFTIGGSVAIDLIDGLDYDLIKQNPKIIAGISDSTTLLTPITDRTGLITFHGIEFLQYAEYDMQYQVETLQRAWFDGSLGQYSQNDGWKDLKGHKSSYTGWESFQKGSAVGEIVGGNSTCFQYFLNTDYQPDMAGKILVLEGYMKPKREIHRLLMQYKIRRAFDEISGLIIGYWNGSEETDEEGNDRPLKDLVIETVGRPDLPILHVGEIGHQVSNLILPIGAKARIDADKLEFEILESTTD